jgi:N-acylneuraminate cytidylyltransferase
MRIAIIPARGGSKRIPYKNIKFFCGKPMISWSIQAAINSGCFDHIVVSTDDADIANVARASGAEVPFMRPAELSDDLTGTGAVIKHAVEWVELNWGGIDLVCTIYATAPFVRASDILEAYQLKNKSGAQIVFSVTSFPFPIQRAIKINPQGRVEMFYPENYLARSQDLEPAFHDAAQFYWADSNAIINGASAFSTVAAPFILPRYRVQDIDTPEDWIRAELMFQALSTANLENK